jgi:hypothetical protein
MEEHQAWEIIGGAVQNHLRIAPAGHVLGLDLGPALQLARARGHDLDVLSELLPAAEAGVLEALNRPAED